ncbi:MAG: prephenate dehydrogenase [Halolamina sp.]
MELLVVGAGEMGRWLARTVGADVAFADHDPDAAAAAAESVGADPDAAGAARTVALDTAETFDGVCLAVPLSATVDAIGTHADRAERALFDVAGAMAGPVAAMAEHRPDCERASFHPLFAPPRAPGTVAAVVDRSGPVVEAVRNDLAAAGNEVFDTTPEEHDAAMETVQVGAHAAILSYAVATEAVPEPFHTPVSAELESLAETVTGGSSAVYAEIQAAFDGAEGVAEAAEAVADADEAAFAELYDAARRRVNVTARESVAGEGEDQGGVESGNESESEDDPETATRDPDPEGGV